MGGIDVAHFCVYHQQHRNLKLKPWETIPANAHLDDYRIAIGGPDVWRIRVAVRLRNRLLKAGLSQFEPDPAGALRARGDG